MTTERMTDEQCADAVNLAQQWWTPEHVGVRLAHEAVRARRVEQEQGETIQDQARLIVSLREQLRLTNDKMAEQVRQARHDMASEVLEDVERFKDLDDVLEFLHKVRIANATKD